MSAPPAEGARVGWHDVPEPVREAIESVCGSPVIAAVSQRGGFSPGVAARVRCGDGGRWFVKAVSAAFNSESPQFHRREARVLADLGPLIAAGRVPAPRLRGTVALGPWFALVVDDVDGSQPALPWRDDQLASVVAAIDRLHEALTPAPVRVPAVAECFETDFTGWRTLASAPENERLDPWSRAHLAELADLEATWAVHAAGDTVLHADIRADNLLLADGGVTFVDWPHACRGAAFVDLVLSAPSVAMQGGPEPAAFLAMSRAGREASGESVTAIVCAMSGFFTAASLRAPPPGLPTLRRFQAAQGEAARRWLAALLN